MNAVVTNSMWTIPLVAIVIAGTGCGDNTSVEKGARIPEAGSGQMSSVREPGPPEPAVAPSAQATAIADNLTKGLYTALVLHKGESVDDLEGTVRSLTGANSKADCVVADARDASLRSLFRELQLDPETAPTPLTIVLAPNKVVTGVFMRPPNVQQFTEAILPEQPLALRKALADGKTVIVKMQTDTSAGNAETDKAIAQFLSGAGKGGKTVAMPVALDRPENGPFLRQLKIDPEKETKSVILAMAPPLKVLSKPYRGAATREVVAAMVAPACGSSCASGST
jgi:hypothetical protein